MTFPFTSNGFPSGRGNSDRLKRPKLTISNLSDDGLTASWEAVDDATGYKVFVNQVEVYSGANLTFNVTGLDPWISNAIQVKAFNAEKESSFALFIKPSKTLQQPTLSLVSKTDTTINLSGTNPDNLPDVELYQNGVLISTGSLTTWELTGLTESTSYTFTMRVGSGGNWSPMSSPLTVVTDEVGSEPVEPPIVDKNTFEPDFTGVANGTPLRTLDGWSAYGAEGDTHVSRDTVWQVSNENIVRLSTGEYATLPGRFIIAHDVGTPDHIFRFRANASVVVVVGSSGNSNATVIEFGATTRIRQNVNGTLSSTIFSTSASGSNFDAEIKLINGVVHLSQNGNNLTNNGVTLPVNIGGTLVGFGTNGGATKIVENVYIAPLTTYLVADTRLLFTPTNNTVGDVEIMGTYENDITGLQCKYIGNNDSTESDWMPAINFEKNSGEFTAKISVPLCSLDGNKSYSVLLRPYSDLDAVYRLNKVVVGYMVAAYGQSNSILRDGLTGGDQITTPRSYDIDLFLSGGQRMPNDRWIQRNAGTTLGQPIAIMAYELSQLLRVPTGVALFGVGSQTISALIGDTLFNPFRDAVINLGGQDAVKAWLWTQGEGEADATSTNPLLNYPANFNSLQTKLNAISEAPISIAMISRGAYNPDPPRPNWGPMRRTLFNLQSLGGVELGHHHAEIPLVDTFHYTQDGYYEANRRASLSIAQQLGADTYNGRGPIVTSGTRSGSTITLNVDLNGATSLIGSNLNYWDVSTDDFATTLDITSVNVVANQVVIELANAPSGAVKVRSFWSSNYGHGDQPAPVFAIGNYADGTTIALEPLFEPLSID